ncbi:MAG: 2-phospho-L-lactate transferase CofD family protein, partial [Candidatus Omnitrophica bacterium]|nr:2-phospho-L-lactate transferase CofD family protein [Candidatus Omnitrophota bacterium]
KFTFDIEGNIHEDKKYGEGKSFSAQETEKILEIVNQAVEEYKGRYNANKEEIKNRYPGFFRGDKNNLVDDDLVEPRIEQRGVTEDGGVSEIVVQRIPSFEQYAEGSRERKNNDERTKVLKDIMARLQAKGIKVHIEIRGRTSIDITVEGVGGSLAIEDLMRRSSGQALNEVPDYVAAGKLKGIFVTTASSPKSSSTREYVERNLPGFAIENNLKDASKLVKTLIGFNHTNNAFNGALTPEEGEAAKKMAASVDPVSAGARPAASLNSYDGTYDIIKRMGSVALKGYGKIELEAILNKFSIYFYQTRSHSPPNATVDFENNRIYIFANSPDELNPEFFARILAHEAAEFVLISEYHLSIADVHKQANSLYFSSFTTTSLIAKTGVRDFKDITIISEGKFSDVMEAITKYEKAILNIAWKSACERLELRFPNRISPEYLYIRIVENATRLSGVYQGIITLDRTLLENRYLAEFEIYEQLTNILQAGRVIYEPLYYKIRQSMEKAISFYSLNPKDQSRLAYFLLKEGRDFNGFLEMVLVSGYSNSEKFELFMNSLKKLYPDVTGRTIENLRSRQEKNKLTLFELIFNYCHFKSATYQDMLTYNPEAVRSAVNLLEDHVAQRIARYPHCTIARRIAQLTQIMGIGRKELMEMAMKEAHKTLRIPTNVILSMFEPGVFIKPTTVDKFGSAERAPAIVDYLYLGGGGQGVTTLELSFLNWLNRQPPEIREEALNLFGTICMVHDDGGHTRVISDELWASGRYSVYVPAVGDIDAVVQWATRSAVKLEVLDARPTGTKIIDIIQERLKQMHEFMSEYKDDSDPMLIEKIKKSSHYGKDALDFSRPLDWIAFMAANLYMAEFIQANLVNDQGVPLYSLKDASWKNLFYIGSMVRSGMLIPAGDHTAPILDSHREPNLLYEVLGLYGFAYSMVSHQDATLATINSKGELLVTEQTEITDVGYSPSEADKGALLSPVAQAVIEKRDIPEEYLNDAVIFRHRVMPEDGKLIFDNVTKRIKWEYRDITSEEMPQANPVSIAMINTARKAIIMGEASMFTSALADLIVPGVARAIANRKDIPRIYIVKVSTDIETAGLSIRRQIKALENSVYLATGEYIAFEDMFSHIIVAKVSAEHRAALEKAASESREKLSDPETIEGLKNKTIKLSKFFPAELNADLDKAQDVQFLNELEARGVKVVITEDVRLYGSKLVLEKEALRKRIMGIASEDRPIAYRGKLTFEQKRIARKLAKTIDPIQAGAISAEGFKEYCSARSMIRDVNVVDLEGYGTIAIEAILSKFSIYFYQTKGRSPPNATVDFVNNRIYVFAKSKYELASDLFAKIIIHEVIEYTLITKYFLTVSMAHRLAGEAGEKAIMRYGIRLPQIRKIEFLLSELKNTDDYIELWRTSDCRVEPYSWCSAPGGTCSVYTYTHILTGETQEYCGGPWIDSYEPPSQLVSKLEFRRMAEELIIQLRKELEDLPSAHTKKNNSFYCFNPFAIVGVALLFNSIFKDIGQFIAAHPFLAVVSIVGSIILILVIINCRLKLRKLIEILGEDTIGILRENHRLWLELEYYLNLYNEIIKYKENKEAVKDTLSYITSQLEVITKKVDKGDYLVTEPVFDLSHSCNMVCEQWYSKEGGKYFYNYWGQDGYWTRFEGGFEITKESLIEQVLYLDSGIFISMVEKRITQLKKQLNDSKEGPIAFNGSLTPEEQDAEKRAREEEMLVSAGAQPARTLKSYNDAMDIVQKTGSITVEGYDAIELEAILNKFSIYFYQTKTLSPPNATVDTINNRIYIFANSPEEITPELLAKIIIHEVIEYTLTFIHHLAVSVAHKKTELILQQREAEVNYKIASSQKILCVCNYNHNRSPSMEMVLDYLIKTNGLAADIEVSSGAIKTENRDGWGTRNEPLKEAFRIQFGQEPKDVVSKMLTSGQVMESNIIIAATEKIKQALITRFPVETASKVIIVLEEVESKLNINPLAGAVDERETDLYAIRQTIEQAIWPYLRATVLSTISQARSAYTLASSGLPLRVAYLRDGMLMHEFELFLNPAF